MDVRKAMRRKASQLPRRGGLELAAPSPAGPGNSNGSAKDGNLFIGGHRPTNHGRAGKRRASARSLLALGRRQISDVSLSRSALVSRLWTRLTHKKRRGQDQKLLYVPVPHLRGLRLAGRSVDMNDMDT